MKTAAALVLALCCAHAFAYPETVKLTRDPEGIEEGNAMRVFTNKGHISIPIEDERLYSRFLKPDMAKDVCVELETDTETLPEYNKKIGGSRVSSVRIVQCPARLGGGKRAAAKPGSDLMRWNFDPTGQRTDSPAIGPRAIEGKCVMPRQDLDSVTLYANPRREGPVTLPAHHPNYNFVLMAGDALVKEQLVTLLYADSTGNGKLGKDGQFFGYGNIRDYVIVSVNLCLL